MCNRPGSEGDYGRKKAAAAKFVRKQITFGLQGLAAGGAGQVEGATTTGWEDG